MTFSCWTISTSLAVLLLRLIAASDEKATTQDKAPNPHMDSGLCLSCHTSQSGGRETLRFGGNTSPLCLSCHDGRLAPREAHVVDVVPSETVARKIPEGFPLERDKLTCLSCHDLTQDCKGEPGTTSANRNRLRGGSGSDPVAFCFQCHTPQDYRPFNAHDQLEAGKPKSATCLWCHVAVPEVETSQGQNASSALRSESSGVCRNCHTVPPDHPQRAHMHATLGPEMLWHASAYELQFKMRLPFPQLLKYVRATKRVPRSLPLDEKGRVTCYSCHNPHEKGLLPEGNPRSVGAEPKHAANHRVRSQEGKVCGVCHQK